MKHIANLTAGFALCTVLTACVKAAQPVRLPTESGPVSPKNDDRKQENQIEPNPMVWAAGENEYPLFIADSIWNTPIGPEPTYDSHSAEMIATIGRFNDGQITSDATKYSYPIYFANEDTPLWDVPCLIYNCTVVTSKSTYKTEILRNVPIPPNANPSAGTDAQMIIFDRNTNTEYDLWKAERTETGWKIGNGSVYDMSWTSTPLHYGSRGAGVPYYAGLILPWEILNGHIDHALAFAYPEVAKDRCVFPATKTDGKSDLPYAIPEGARLQLDPTLTDENFEQMGLNRTGKIIAHALQGYGMFLIDVAGRPKIYAEDLENNPYVTHQWSDPSLDLTSTTISAIPYRYFRVLELPAAYWDPTLPGAFHTNCHKFSAAN
jgi:hypothetical protein